MTIETIIYGPLKNNCYLISCDITQEAVVIDPGGRSKEILRMIKEKGLTVKYIIITHKHRDQWRGQRGYWRTNCGRGTRCR